MEISESPKTAPLRCSTPFWVLKLHRLVFKLHSTPPALKQPKGSYSRIGTSGTLLVKQPVSKAKQVEVSKGERGFLGDKDKPRQPFFGKKPSLFRSCSIHPKCFISLANECNKSIDGWSTQPGWAALASETLKPTSNCKARELQCLYCVCFVKGFWPMFQAISSSTFQHVSSEGLEMYNEVTSDVVDISSITSTLGCGGQMALCITPNATRGDKSK